MILSIERRPPARAEHCARRLIHSSGVLAAAPGSPRGTDARPKRSMASRLRNRVGICGPGAERLHMPFLHETRHSGQPNCYMNDLALAPRAQLETASLEQL